MHGGKIVAKALAREGVGALFTLCGGHIQHIYDGCIDEGIWVVDCRHEQSAGHAADGWARATGRPGVAAVTAGPGVTDIVTAVANAQRAGVPMVVFGGQGPLMFSGRGSLQEMDHVGLMRSVTKRAVTVTDTARLGEAVTDAFRVACSGLPGPVFVEVPLDVLMGEAEPADVDLPSGYRTEARPAGDPRYVEQLVAALARAERPVLIAGSQLRWSPDGAVLARFLDRFPMPAFVSGMARGLLEPGHPCLLRRSRRAALAEADLVCVLGTPLDFRLGYGRAPAWNASARLVRIDLEGEQIGHNRGADIGIVGDPGLVLDGALAAAEGPAPATWQGWIERLREEDERRIAKMRAEMDADDVPVNPLRLCAEIDRVLPDDAVVIGDGGDFVATAANVVQIGPRGLWMDPGPLGTLGVGPGYAMAAKLARPDSEVVILFGDGSFGLNGFEYEAMVRQGLKVVGIVGNDAAWTQIRRGQVEIFGAERSVATELSLARYDRVVEALGGHGEFVERPEQLRPALDRAFAADRAALVNVHMGATGFRKGAISV